jgi:hypothetical protein
VLKFYKGKEANIQPITMFIADHPEPLHFCYPLVTHELHSRSVSEILRLDSGSEEVSSFSVDSGASSFVEFLVVDKESLAFCCCSNIFCKYLACSSMRSCSCLCT